MTARPVRKAAAVGMKSLSLASATVAVIQFVQVGVLAYLLEPKDFGLMASVVVIIGFAQAFGDMGLSNSIIAHQDTSKPELSTLYWGNLAAGAAVGALVLASTPLVVAFYGEPRLASLMPWAAVTFVIAPLGQQTLILLQKDLEFRPIARVQVGGAIGSLFVAISAAMLGFGALSLIWGLLAYSIIQAAAFFAIGRQRGWLPGLHFRWAELRRHSAFGAYQMGERSVNYLSSNVDYLLIGRFLGAEALGVYSLAYQLVLKPVMLVNPVFMRVAFPAFSTRQDNPVAIARGYTEITRAIALVALPVTLALVFTGPMLVPMVFGAQWELTGSVVQILALAALGIALGNPVGALLLAKKRPDLGLKVNVLRLVLMVVAIRLAVDGGIITVAWVFAGVVFVFVAIWLGIVNRVGGVPWRGLARAVAAPARYAATAGLVMLAVDVGLRQTLTGTAARPLLLLAAGAVTYVALLFRYEGDYLKDIFALLRPEKKGSRRTRAGVRDLGGRKVAAATRRDG